MVCGQVGAFPPTAVARSSRLLLAFTKRTIRGCPNLSPPAPAAGSIASLEEKKLWAAKQKIHKVIIAFYPTCRRLRGLEKFADGGPRGDSDGSGGELAAAGKSADGAAAASSTVMHALVKNPSPPVGGGGHTDEYLESCAKQNGHAIKHAAPEHKADRENETKSRAPPPVRSQTTAEPEGGGKRQAQAEGHSTKRHKAPCPAHPAPSLCLASTTGDNAVGDLGMDGDEHGKKLRPTAMWPRSNLGLPPAPFDRILPPRASEVEQTRFPALFPSFP